MKYLSALALLAISMPLLAAPTVKTEHVEAQLLAERTAAQPSKPIVVGLQLRMAPHWHTYWKNPGDSGLPTHIQWVLPEGWKSGAIQWPYPKPLPIGPLTNYGYEDEVVLLSELTPPASATGTAKIKAQAEWLVCKDICIPEKGELDIAIPVAAVQGALDPRTQFAIANARSMLPVEANAWKFESAIVGKSLIVRMMPPQGQSAPAKAMFFPERENLIEPAAPQRVVRDGSGIRIEMKLTEPIATDVRSVSGVAVSDAGWAKLGKAIEVVAPAAILPPVAAGTTSNGGAANGGPIGGSALVALAFAFLGGVLLNLMPCVFPVIFGVGVLLSFFVLAGLMLALRSTGAQLGWGFQLQSPAFVTMLAALFFVLALNLSGVFEWGAFAQSMTSDVGAKGRYADAFLAGVLATVVATPCTAPFMGAAVGFTLSQSAGVALAVFAMLGIGMAMPVVALSFFPALLRKLPRPGAWMETFKQVLAFPLYATVAWLAWVVGAQAGNDAVLMLLGGLVLVAMGAWVFGRWGHSENMLYPVMAATLAVVGLVVAWPHAEPDAAPIPAPMAKAGELPWQAWSPETVRDLSAEGRPVFVDFTAAWCVTCQVNKRVALHNHDVVKAFADKGVVPLRADWTRQDPRITATLSSLGRNAVPVYALYVPGASEPQLLPEVLTPSVVLEALAKLPPPKAGTAITQR
jgi:thiol:disulfide interchange protein DsbD